LYWLQNGTIEYRGIFHGSYGGVTSSVSPSTSPDGKAAELEVAGSTWQSVIQSGNQPGLILYQSTAACVKIFHHTYLTCVRTIPCSQLR